MRIPDPELQEITSKFRETGDADLRDKIIMSHVPLAFAYMRRSGFRGFTRFEYLGELFYAIVDGVTKARTTLVNNNITPYIKSCLKSRTTHYKSRLPLIRIPRRAYSEGYRPPRVKTLNPECSQSPKDRSDLLDFVFSNAHEAIEVQILLGVMEGKNYEEIGSELNLTRARVSQIAGRMRDRMNRRLRFIEEDTDVKCCNKNGDASPATR